jgi:transcriptional regulator with XRE-family HTH domain
MRRVRTSNQQREDDSDGEIARRVGPRLRSIRTAAGITLAELSVDTGIAASVLSRLETGARQPTLVHLLALARRYNLPVDELIGTPQRGDPRSRPRPVAREGMTLLPLTVRPGGIQAYKVLYPPASQWGAPALRTHEGHQWFCVLAGRLRFILEDQVHDLHPGDSVEYDTSRPHWIGSASEQTTEVVMLFSASGLRHSPALKTTQ